MAEGNKFNLKIITPDREFYEGDVDMVEFNTIEGEVGIYKGHIPISMIIAPGVLTITVNGESKNAALHSGFVEVLPDSVSILAEIIEWPSEIDVERAQEAKERAETRIRDVLEGTDIARAELALRRAITRINVTQ
ncbi:MAG: ATP synthase F1 subunit epsilon [Lachnospiraceae bacterium]|nr:ATP synthase F1 subunit epsilon [Lachnospiraceae bacterium]